MNVFRTETQHGYRFKTGKAPSKASGLFSMWEIPGTEHDGQPLLPKHVHPNLNGDVLAKIKSDSFYDRVFETSTLRC
jgi:hypothetical protein